MAQETNDGIAYRMALKQATASQSCAASAREDFVRLLKKSQQ